MRLSQFFQQMSPIQGDLDAWALQLAEPEPVEGEDNVRHPRY